MAPNTTVTPSQLKEPLGDAGIGVVYHALDIQATHLLPDMLPGTTLATLIQASSPRLTPDFVVEIMVQVCRGIQAAHEDGILHAALNPSNILILEDNTAKIVHFSLAHTAGNQPASGWLGAQDYLAPEQPGDANANLSADVFSLGVIAYEALTLHQPFKRSTLEETAEAIRHFVPQPISEKNPQVPQLVGKAVQVALAKLPDHRYATAGEFADRLEEAASYQQIERFDPANADAIFELLDRARTHLDRHDFPEAHRALAEIFNLKYDHPEAARLKSALDAHETEANIARAEKEKLFTAVQRHYRNGELGSALTQLEKLLALSRNVPASCIPERESVFEALCAELRSERGRIGQCCTEAARALAEHNFEKALAICDSLQARYPNNQEFQALRLKAQQAQRHQLLVYVGEVARSLETQPNLDGRVYLLQEAVKRYPNEELLARQLSLACEQRDLAASIVAKARTYEIQGQFEETIDQWKALLSIYPLYPGLAAEIQQLEQRREQKAEEDKRSRFITEIGRALTSGAYTDAERLSQEGLREFPEQPQLLALLDNAHQGFEKCREADRLLEEARTVSSHGDPDRAMTLLRQALDLDPRHIVARNTLINLLLERTRALLATDTSAAELLAAEAARLDPEHSSVQKILKLVAKAKPKKPWQPALLEAASGISPNGHQTLDPARIESIPAPQPTKLFLDDDFSESPRASHRTVPQPPQPSREPAILQQFREIGSVFAYNVKSRLLDSDLAPHLQKLSESSRIPLTARQIRGFMLSLLGALVPLLLVSFAYRYASRPHVPKPMTGPEARISSAPPGSPVTIQTAPSYASVAPDGDPDASTTPPLEPVSRQRTFDSSPADQTIERPPAANLSSDGRSTHPKRPIAVQKDVPGNRHVDASAKAPLPTRFTISSGTPGANIIVDDVNIGELDEKGNFAYAGIAAGTHKIELSKPGHGSRTFYGQTFLPGKPFDLPGDKRLTAVAGYARITVSPLSAAVSYKRSGESAKHPVSDLYRALALPPGAYEFTAEAPQFASKLVDIKIQADQTAAISFDLKPSARTVAEQNTELVNPDEATKTDGRWYHGRTDKYIRLTTNSPTNTLLFSKESKVKRTSWRVNLDGNMITYTLDAKGISIEKHIDAHDSTERIKTDLRDASTPFESYAVTVKLAKNDVIIARPDGTPLHTTHTEDHDWSQAGIFAKGDTYFSFLPGR